MVVWRLTLLTITSALLLVLAAPALGHHKLGHSPRPVEAGQLTETDPRECSGHSWFVGIVYDAEQRDDFAVDIEHFERFADELGETHCIPPEQSTILGFDEGSEANLKAELRRVATEAKEHDDSQLFFFLSSHGNASSGLLSAIGASACPPTRVVGSYAALKESSGEAGSSGEDGFLDDCELGDELARFEPSTRMFVAVDCSFCGGFSDSLTAASGTLPDGGVPTSSGVPGPRRVVITGCAITTECFGSRKGGNLYRHMDGVLSDDVAACDGWTAPAFPQVQGADVPVRGATDGRCTASEWFFASVNRAYTQPGEIGNFEHHIDHVLSIQQQFRIKYGFDSLDQDILIR